MNPFLNSVDMFKSAIRWKWHLLVIALLSMLAAVVFSGPAFIKPKYKSFAIVYPSNLIAYSTENSTEQMLQLLQSSDIREEVFRIFNLMQHYEIDTVKNPHARTEIIKTYEENVLIHKTEYESVHIEVWDTDPIIAAAMVDSIIQLGNKKIRALQRQKAEEVLVIAGIQISRKKAEMDSMENVLKNYSMKFGLLEYKIQTKEFSRAYLKSISSGTAKGANESKNMLSVLAEHGEEFNALSERLALMNKTFVDLKVIYDNALRDATKVLSYTNVVTQPLVADNKSYPIRWLIVTVSMISSLFIAFLVLLMFASGELTENKKN
jgi:capsule polysaccharide export protein KpsE/RkpR